MTQTELILQAAASLPQPFTAADLVVAAWKLDPEKFGMEDHPYPCSNRVLACLMGEKGLVGRGWLERVKSKVYQLTEAGRLELSYLLPLEKAPVKAMVHRNGHAPKPAKPKADKPKLARPPLVNEAAEQFLRTAFASQAWQKWRENRATDLTFYDAGEFFGLSATTNGLAVEAALLQVAVALARLKADVVPLGVLMSDGRHVNPADVNGLLALSEGLQTRFARHLNLLRARTGKEVRPAARKSGG